MSLAKCRNSTQRFVDKALDEHSTRLQHEKDIYVFDEPDTNLDFNSQREMIKIFDELKKRGKAVVIISHNEHTLDCCDKFYSLENGKIIEQE